MPSQLLRGSAAEVTTNLSLAFNGTVPSNPIFTSYTAEFARVGEFALANAFAAAYSNVTNAALTTQVLSNLGVTATTIGTASYAALASAVETAFAAFPTARGQVALNLARLLAGLENDTTYGAAATAWNNNAAATFVYASNTANTTSTTLTALNAPVARTLQLTSGADTLVGSGANDTFVGLIASGALGVTVFDSLDGGDGTDTLSFINTNTTGANTDVTLNSAVTGLTIKNIENITATTAAGAINIDTTIAGISGVTSLTASANAGAVTLNAAATTNVTATASALAGNGITVTGGKDVVVTATGAATGSISVGSATAPAAGTVTISDVSTGANTGGVTVVGGTTISVTTGTGRPAVGASPLQQGAVNITGSTATTSVTVAQTPAVANSSTAGGEIKAGAVTIADNASTGTTTDTITSVTLREYGVGSSISSKVLTNLTLNGSASSTDIPSLSLTFNAAAATGSTAATTLNLTSEGGSLGAITGTLADTYTTVNVNSAATTTLGTSTAASSFTKATAVNFTGAAGTTAWMNVAPTAAITVTGAGGVGLGVALAVGQSFTGGAGADTVTLTGGFTKAIDMGAGNDTVTYAAPSTTTPGSVNAGAGVDTIRMTAAQAVSVSGGSDFNSVYTGFEALSLLSVASGGAPLQGTINLVGLNSVQTVTIASGTAGSALNSPADNAVIGGLQSGGTVSITTAATSGGDGLEIKVRDAEFGLNDVLNLSTSTSGSVVTAAGVETINLSLPDTSLQGNASVRNLTLKATGTTSLVVSGSNGLNLTNTGNTKITNFDASRVVSNGDGLGGDDTADGLAVTFASANSTATATVTITGGAGNDVLTGNAAKDIIVGGAGKDVIRGGTGSDTLTGGAGDDTFVFNYANTGATPVSDSALATFDVVTDFTAGDSIQFLMNGTATALIIPTSAAGNTQAAAVSSRGVATFDTVVATRTDTLGGKVAAVNAALSAVGQFALFTHDGATYMFINVDTSNANDSTEGILVQLVGVALPTATTPLTGVGTTGGVGLGG